MRICLKSVCVVSIWLGFVSQLWADVLPLPGPGNYVVGEVRTVRAKASETLLDIARRFDVGYEEIAAANPEVEPWLPQDGATITIPSQYILPDSPRKGIVINLAEMRLYYYPKQQRDGTKVVITHPLGIGRDGWSTPLGHTSIISKVIDPSWYPPASIRKEHKEQGEDLPLVVPAGPDNPLGRYAMQLGHKKYLIHGTNEPLGIGMRVSHGCLRMYPEDIESLFSQVAVGTPVLIMDQPFKLGKQNGVMFAEAHKSLIIDNDHPDEVNLTDVVRAVVASTDKRLRNEDWKKLFDVAQRRNGMPAAVGELNQDKK